MRHFLQFPENLCSLFDNFGLFGSSLNYIQFNSFLFFAFSFFAFCLMTSTLILKHQIWMVEFVASNNWNSYQHFVWQIYPIDLFNESKSLEENISKNKHIKTFWMLFGPIPHFLHRQSIKLYTNEQKIRHSKMESFSNMVLKLNESPILDWIGYRVFFWLECNSTLYLNFICESCTQKRQK